MIGQASELDCVAADGPFFGMAAKGSWCFTKQAGVTLFSMFATEFPKYHDLLGQVNFDMATATLDPSVTCRNL